MRKKSVLVVDDDEAVRKLCHAALRNQYEVEATENGADALARLQEESFDLVVTDVNMPVMGGIELIEAARKIDADLPFLVLTGFPTVETAVAAMKLGAADYMTKPLRPDELVATVEALLEHSQLRYENRTLSRHVEQPYKFDDIVGESPSMQKVFKLIEQVAATNVDVLVTGETGTGKELIARSIHRRSSRSNERFVPVNCSAIPDNLLESELFGHEKGAFTGADARHIGLIEYSSKGTFFMDEVGDLPQGLQAKLLRMLQERTIRRVGGKDEIPVDLRVVAATSIDLDNAVAEKHFREDLYYRINVMRIDLPPLRERPEDMALLANHFLERFKKQVQKVVTAISSDAMDVLRHHRWPGNIRELQNAIHRALVVCTGEEITPDDLPSTVVEALGTPATGLKGGFFELRDQRIAVFERDYLSAQLQRHQGDVATAADEAEIPKGTYYRLMKKYDLTAGDFK